MASTVFSLMGILWSESHRKLEKDLLELSNPIVGNPATEYSPDMQGPEGNDHICNPHGSSSRDGYCIPDDGDNTIYIRMKTTTNRGRSPRQSSFLRILVEGFCALCVSLLFSA